LGSSSTSARATAAGSCSASHATTGPVMPATSGFASRAGVVAEHRAVHLAGYADRTRPNRRERGSDPGQGGVEGRLPDTGVGLRPARMRTVDLVARLGRSQLLAARSDESDFEAARAQVDAEETVRRAGHR
jgi:hypothetical protein